MTKGKRESTGEKVFRVVTGVTFADGRRLEMGDMFDGPADDVGWLVECGAIEEVR